MKRIFPIDGLTFAKRVLALVSCTLALASLTLAPAAAQEPTGEQLRALAARVLDLVNQEREQWGVSPLAWSDELAYAARRHSEDMADHNFFSHTGSDGSTINTRIQEASGYGFWKTGENINFGVATAEDTVLGWRHGEAEDRANILDYFFREIGVAVRYNADYAGYYWTMDVAG